MLQTGVKLPGLDFQFHCWFIGRVTSQGSNEKNILQIFAHVNHHGYIILPWVYASKPQAYQWYILLPCSPQILLHKHRHRPKPKWFCEDKNIAVLKLLTCILETATASHSSTLAWKIPWMEEPGGLQSMGWLRVGQDSVTSLSLFTFMHWRRKWQPTPLFLPGGSQGRGNLVGCHLWGHTESDTTEVT